MLQAFGLSVIPDPREGYLFKDVDLSIGRGQKVALVGRNGAGKSLLLRILAGELQPNSGRVVLKRGMRLAYLRQDFDLDFRGSFRDYLEQQAPEVSEHAVARTLYRLGVELCLLDRNFSSLSLGERMRGVLAALLAMEPDLLLLDEPTNHLDLPTKEWLEKFLAECPEAVLFACHDRVVLNRIADRILELEHGRLTAYTGNFDSMNQAKAHAQSKQRQEFEKHREEDRRLRIVAEEVLQRAGRVTRKPTGRTYDPKAKAFYAGKQSKMDRRAKAVLKRVEQAREDGPQKPFEADALELVFPTMPLRDEHVLTVRDLTMSFGERTLFAGLNLTLSRGDRLAIVGPNGAGKTTLLRILMGDLEPTSGTVYRVPSVKCALLSQARELLEDTLPGIQALMPRDREQEEFARTALGRLGVRGDMVHRPLKVLSVGERTKFELVSMLMSGANLLMLDEPTNHIDLATIEVLESALGSFPGALIFISHDRAFVGRLATEVLTIGEDLS